MDSPDSPDSPDQMAAASAPSFGEQLNALKYGGISRTKQELALRARADDSDAESDSDDDDSSDDAPRPKRAAIGKKPKASKKAPVELSAKKPVSRFRKVVAIPVSQKRLRDPRFEDLAGKCVVVVAVPARLFLSLSFPLTARTHSFRRPFLHPPRTQLRRTVLSDKIRRFSR